MEKGITLPFRDVLGASALEGVLIIDTNGKILSANRAAETLLGYGAGQLTNMYLTEFWTSGLPAARANGERHRPDGARDHDGALTRRNGQPLPVSLAVAPLSAADEGEQIVSFVSRDELERLNESLVHAQRLAGIGTLTTSVAHELTNPISVITATCMNLRDELEAETLGREDLARYVEMIEQSAFRCARIVEVLRNYAHNAGRGSGDDAAIAITSPAAVAQDALMMVEQQFRKQANVAVAVDLEEGLQTIFCDHHRIAQVLINLLTNARDAMQPQGGTIRLRFWTPPGHEGEWFAFAVSDTGTGIDPAVRPRIFEPFFTTKPNGQGTGLGLYIAEGIVRQHGGRITVENNADRGVTVTVCLPRRQRQAGDK